MGEDIAFLIRFVPWTLLSRRLFGQIAHMLRFGLRLSATRPSLNTALAALEINSYL